MEFIEVFQTNSASELAYIKSLLDGANIKYFVDGETFIRMHGSALPQKIKVQEDKLSQAEEIIKGFSENKNNTMDVISDEELIDASSKNSLNIDESSKNFLNNEEKGFPEKRTCLSEFFSEFDLKPVA